jgi:N-acetyl-gamma-glutamyl-phosphate reductase
MNKIRVGIYGASGYMGGEALRILLEHPQAEIAWITSRATKELHNVHPNFYGDELTFVSPEDTTECDVVFCALPTGAVAPYAEKALAQGAKVIDLGAEFRLEDRATWERVYKKTHPNWDLAQEAVFGVVELHREEIRSARLVANPGCYSSAAILGLAPLAKTKLIDVSCIVVDGLSGTAGAGAELDRAVHHPEIANNIVTYNVVDHRHTYEMEQELGKLAGEPVRVHFSCAYVPISRGITALCHGFTLSKTSREEVLQIYREFYQDSQFVKVLDVAHEVGASWQYRPYPWVSITSGTNYCYIGVDYDAERERVIVISTLDSVGKGGAHVGIQNMNLMCGLPEHIGLERRGLHPY